MKIADDFLYLCTLLCVGLILAHPTQAATTSQSTIKNTMTPIEQSPSDNNAYQAIQLNNGLQVLLVSDPQAEKAAASLAVNIGSYQDPENREGLAHFLEHMLFLGTQKYPEAGAYQAYINQHGGANNAYTSHDTTNYYFDIQTEAFDGALDRFSQFFSAPLFSEEFTQREKNAVNSEYLAKINDDQRRSHQAFKTLLNPQHPQSRFSVGSLDTLKDRPETPLKTQLLNLYKNHYVAGNMALVLISNSDLEELEKQAKRYFSDIANTTSARTTTTSSTTANNTLWPPLTKQNTPQLQFLRPVADINKLSFSFPIPSQRLAYKSQPSRYLAYLLGHEGKGSLYAFLKQQGWINNLSAGNGSTYGNEQLFSVQFQLTSLGLSKIDAVASAFFYALNTVKNTPINPTYLKENQVLSQLGFDYHDYVHPIKLASILSSQLLRLPTKDILTSFKISDIASDKEIQALMAHLTVDNMLVQVISQQELPTHWAQDPIEWTDEPWYHSHYSNHFLSQNTLERLRTPTKQPEITTPEANPFLPENLSLINAFDEQPHIIFQHAGLQYWHRADNRFHKPTSNNYLAIRFDHAADTAEHYLLNLLLTRMFNDSLSTQTYLPYLAGLGYSLYPHINGFTISTNGYSDKQFDYLGWLLKQLLSFTPLEDRFELAKHQLQKDLNNQQNAAPHQLAMAALADATIENTISNQDLISALPDITFDQLTAFQHTALNSFNLVGFSNGNVTADQSKIFADKLLTTTRSRLNNHTGTESQAKTFDASQRLSYAFSSTNKDQAIVYAIQGRYPFEQTTTLHNKALLALTNQLITTAFYNQLRTQQQFGYIVSSQLFELADVPTLAFTVQSPDKNTTDIINAIEGFLTNQTSELLQLTDADFNNAKQVLLHKLRREPKSLQETTRRDWLEIAKQETDFLRRERLIALLEKLQKTEFLQFIEEIFGNGKATRLIIHNSPLEVNALTLKQDWQAIH